MKSVLNKIDILESISPKNNDLSETIQKLESAIQKSGDHTHMSEDTSDSTDSEQRLVIEDESQSSETPNEFVLSKQENDQSYSGKQSGVKEKVVAVSGAAASTAIPTAAEPTPPTQIATIVATPSTTSDKKVHGIDEKQKSTDKTPATSQVPAAPTESISLETDSKPTPIVDPKVEIVDEPSNEQATIVASSSSPAAPALATTPASAATSVLVKTEEECIVDKVLKTEDDLATENAQNESISLLLCEETIPGSPAPACPKEQCDIIKKSSNYDTMFTSPMQVADTIDTKPVPTEPSTTATTITAATATANDAKQKSKNATPRSSPRDSMSQEDSSEENNKKPGTKIFQLPTIFIYHMHGLLLISLLSFAYYAPLTEPDRTGSSKKRRCTRKQSEAETATKRRKATARRNTNTGNMPVQINSNISGTYSNFFLFLYIFFHLFMSRRRRIFIYAYMGT